MFDKSADIYDAIYSFKDYAGECRKLREVIAANCGRPCVTLLDVACGTGVHLSCLRDSYEVAGVDVDEGMLRAARKRNPGVPFSQADMTDFDLGRRFDAVVCLFSAIGYARTQERLEAAVRCMANHLQPGGLLIVEPWILPERFTDGHLSALFVDEPELKLARLAVSHVTDGVSWFDFNYLVATPDGVRHFVERHELGLFTHEQYLRAIEYAGLETAYDPEGFGRGLYLGLP